MYAFIYCGYSTDAFKALPVRQAKQPEDSKATSVNTISAGVVTWCRADDSQPSPVVKTLPRSYDLLSNPLHGVIGETEFNTVIYCVANNSLGPLSRNLIHWVYNFIESFKAAGLRADTDSDIFRACTDTLWKVMTSFLPPLAGFGHVSDEDDQRLFAVVSWLLAFDSEPSLRKKSMPETFQGCLHSGHVQVAYLLWSRMDAAQRLRRPSKYRIFRFSASSRSKDLFPMFREMLSLPEWVPVVLSNAAQYSSMDIFAPLLQLIDTSHPIEPRPQKCDQVVMTRDILEMLVTSCARAEPEQMALAKLQETLDFLLDRSITGLKDLISTDAFMAVAKRGYSEVFDNMVKINSNPGLENHMGFSALQVAAEYGKLELCNKILGMSSHGTDSCILALRVGLLAGHLEVVRALEQHIESITTTSKQWRERLCSCHLQHTCSARDCGLRGQRPPHTGLFEYAGDFGRSIEHCEHYLVCVLCYTTLRACLAGRVDLLESCLNLGADPAWELSFSTMNGYPGTPLDAAVSPFFEPQKFGRFPCHFPSTLPDSEPRELGFGSLGSVGSLDERVDCVRLLLQRGVPPTPRHAEKALLAAEWGMAHLLLDTLEGIPLSMRMLESAICGQSADCIRNIASRIERKYHVESLCAAVFFSSACPLSRSLALELISRRNIQDIGTDIETTAIGIAAMSNDTELLFRLLDCIPKPSQFGIFPTEWWAHREPSGVEKMRKYMAKSAKRGTPCWRSTEEQWKASPLGLAALKTGHETASILLRHGLEPDIAACTIAVSRGRPDILRLLLLHGQPELNQWPRIGFSAQCAPLTEAARKGDLSMACQLLSAGADINLLERKQHAGRSPLQAAAEVGRRDMVEFLLERGADVNGTDVAEEFGGTALQLATAKGHLDVVKLLLDCGADMHAPALSRYGTSCLVGAAIEGRLSTLQLLMERGARTDGEHRLDFVFAVLVAENNSRHFIAQSLRSYGGWTEWDRVAAGTLRNRWQGLGLTNSEKEKIRVQVSLELSRRSSTGDCESNASELRQVLDAPMERGMALQSAACSSPTSTPWPFIGDAFWTQSPGWFEFVDMSTPPQCPGDDKEWLQDWGPFFMRDQMGQDVAVDDDVQLD